MHLLDQPGLVGTLAQRGYGVSLALFEWNTLQATVVRRLTDHGIPVIARLLLPREAGYWFNVENYPQAVAHYAEFREWAIAEKLTFVAVGLDLEPPLRFRSGLRAGRFLSIYSRLQAARTNALFPAALEAYQVLAAEIRSDGYAVHTYQNPFIVDDRRAATTLVQRMLDIVDLPVDIEVLMCYSSLIPRRPFRSDFGGALVAEYGLFADSLGIGSTGGGIITDPDDDEPIPQLSWEAFTRDLRIAARYTDTIHVFSLEGCVASGYLQRLIDFDWSVPVTIAWRYRFAMRILRVGIGIVLWWSRLGLAIMGWLGWVVVAIIMLRRALRRWRA
jgi:hypothetical protein